MGIPGFTDKRPALAERAQKLGKLDASRQPALLRTGVGRREVGALKTSLGAKVEVNALRMRSLRGDENGLGFAGHGMTGMVLGGSFLSNLIAELGTHYAGPIGNLLEYLFLQSGYVSGLVVGISVFVLKLLALALFVWGVVRLLKFILSLRRRAPAY